MFSWLKYLIVNLVFSHLGFWSGILFLIAPFPDLCLLVPFFKDYYLTMQMRCDNQDVMRKKPTKNDEALLAIDEDGIDPVSGKLFGRLTRVNCLVDDLKVHQQGGIWQSGWTIRYHLSRIVRKPDFCLGENKGADQLRSNCEADQRLCFRYSDSIIPLLLIANISSI